MLCIVLKLFRQKHTETLNDGFFPYDKYNNCADDLTELCKEELKSLINFFLCVFRHAVWYLSIQHGCVQGKQ